MNILFLLREGTRDQQRALEAALPLMRPSFTPSEYIGLLQRLYGYYEPLERALGANAPFVRSLGDWPRRKKSHLIEADLLSLGEQARAVAKSAVPEFRTSPAAYGAAYILESATLGGQVISLNIRRKFGYTPGNGGSFFSSYGDDVGSMWLQFQTALIAQSTAANREETLRSARDTITGLYRWVSAPSALYSTTR